MDNMIPKVKILLIIDMQKGFKSAKKKSTILECKKLIRQAKRRKRPIIILEYYQEGETLPELTELLYDYPLTFHALKRKDDGGRAVHKLIRQHHFNVDEIIVCGVNISACVLETCDSLSKRYRIRVIKRACNDEGRWYGRAGWSRYREHANLKKI